MGDVVVVVGGRSEYSDMKLLTMIHRLQSVRMMTDKVEIFTRKIEFPHFLSLPVDVVGQMRRLILIDLALF